LVIRAAFARGLSIMATASFLAVAASASEAQAPGKTSAAELSRQ